MFDLMTFGIPSSDFPIAENGSLTRENHYAWIEKQRAIEHSRKSCSTLSTVAMIDTPIAPDILLGRGKAIQNHLGNIWLRVKLESYFERFEKAGKKEKTEITWILLNAVKQRGGRFLKQEGATYELVDDSIARKKIAHGFRTLRGCRLESMDREAEKVSRQSEQQELAPKKRSRQYR